MMKKGKKLKISKLTKGIVGAVIYNMLIPYNITIYAAGVVIDRSALAKHRAILGKTANGIDQVDIVTPNDRGLSHNKFLEFNVNDRGMILNNSAEMTLTQLAGLIYGNPNLKKDKEAKTILAEITGLNRSEIEGFIEVAGKEAEFILANANGIYLSNGGFINTSRVTLTTGNLFNGVDGNLKIRVIDGIVEVAEGGTINIEDTDYFEIISRAAKIGGALSSTGPENRYTKELKILTGKNVYDYDTKEYTSEDSEGKYSFAIDASELGAMSAGKIKLISTDKGVGVNTRSQMVATIGNLEIDSKGDVTVKTAVTRHGDIKLKSREGSVKQTEDEGFIYSENNIEIDAKKNVELTGKNGYLSGKNQIKITGKNLELRNGSVVSATGEEYKNREILIDVDEKVTIAVGSAVIADKKIDIVGNEVLNEGTINGMDINIESEKLTSGIGSETEAMIYADNSLNIESKEAINEGILVGKQEIRIKGDGSKGFLNIGGISGEGQIEIENYNSLNNSGDIAGTKVELKKIGNGLNSGNIQGKESIAFSGDRLNNSGTIYSEGTISISSNQLVNERSEEEDENGGLIYSKEGMEINSKIINNNKGTISSESKGIKINSEVFTNSGAVSAEENLTIDSNVVTNLERGQIVSNEGTVSLDSDVFYNEGAVFGNKIVIDSENINNSGTFLSDEEGIEITNKIINNSGLILSQENIDINTETLANSGNIISGSSFDDEGDLIESEGYIKISGKDLTNEGSISGVSEVEISGTEKVTNLAGGSITSKKGLIVTTKDLETSGQLVGNAIDITSDNLLNKGLIYSESYINIDSKESVNNLPSKLEDIMTQITVIEFTGERPTPYIYNPEEEAEKIAEIMKAVKNIPGITDIITDIDTLSLEEIKAQISAQFVSASIRAVDNITVNTIKLQNNAQIIGSSMDLSVINLSNEENGLLYALDGGIRIDADQSVINNGTINSAEELMIITEKLSNNGQMVGKGIGILSEILTNKGMIYSKDYINIDSKESVNNLPADMDMEQVKILEGIMSQIKDIEDAKGPSTYIYDPEEEAKIMEELMEEIKNIPGIRDIIRDVDTLTLAGIKSEINNQLTPNLGIINADEKVTINTKEMRNNGQIIGKIIDLSVINLLNEERGLLYTTDGGIIIDAEEAITNLSGGVISSNSEMDITAQKMDNDGQIAGDMIDLTIKDILNKAAGIVYSANGLIINGDIFKNEGAIQNSNGDIAINLSEALTNEGVLYSDGGIGITAKLFVNSGAVQAIENDLSINLSESLTNDGLLYTSDGVIIINATKKVTNLSEGAINSKSDITIITSEIDNDGVIIGNNIDITAKDFLNQEGAVVSGIGNIQIKTEEMENEGAIVSNKNLNINAENITNTVTGQLVGVKANINTNEKLTNDGIILSEDSLEIIAKEIEIGENSLIKGGNTLDITAKSILNRGNILTEGTGILKVGTLQNEESGFIGALNKPTDPEDPNGKTDIGSSLTIEFDTYNNIGDVYSAGTLDFKGEIFENKGKISSKDNMTINVDTLINANKTNVKSEIEILEEVTNQIRWMENDEDLPLNDEELLEAVKNIEGIEELITGDIDTLTLAEIKAQINDQLIPLYGEVGELISAANIIFNVENGIKNTGDILANGDILMDIKNAGLDNRNGSIQSSGNTSIITEFIDNRDGSILAGGDLLLQTITLKNIDGKLISNGKLIIDFTQLGDHTENKTLEGVISGGTLIRVKNFHDIINNQIDLLTNGDIELISIEGNIENSETIFAGGDLTLDAKKGYVKNLKDGEEALISSGNDLTIDAKNYIHNTKSKIFGGLGRTEINLTKNYDNKGKIISYGDIELTVADGKKVTNYGQFQANNDLFITADEILLKADTSLYSSMNMDLLARNGHIINEAGAQILTLIGDIELIATGNVYNKVTTTQAGKIKAGGNIIVSAINLYNEAIKYYEKIGSSDMFDLANMTDDELMRFLLFRNIYQDDIKSNSEYAFRHGGGMSDIWDRDGVVDNIWDAGDVYTITFNASILEALRDSGHLKGTDYFLERWNGGFFNTQAYRRVTLDLDFNIGANDKIKTRQSSLEAGGNLELNLEEDLINGGIIRANYNIDINARRVENLTYASEYNGIESLRLSYKIRRSKTLGGTSAIVQEKSASSIVKKVTVISEDKALISAGYSLNIKASEGVFNKTTLGANMNGNIEEDSDARVDENEKEDLGEQVKVDDLLVGIDMDIDIKEREDHAEIDRIVLDEIERVKKEIDEVERDEKERDEEEIEKITIPKKLPGEVVVVVKPKKIDPLDDIVVPKGDMGIFKKSKDIIVDGVRKPLIETNLEFINQENYYGSSYLFEKLGIENESDYRSLGDDYYETTLINELFLKSTGGRNLDGTGFNEVSLMKYLLDHAILVAEELGLVLGEPLTEEQLKLLSEYTKKVKKDPEEMEKRIALAEEQTDQAEKEMNTAVEDEEEKAEEFYGLLSVLGLKTDSKEGEEKETSSDSEISPEETQELMEKYKEEYAQYAQEFEEDQADKETEKAPQTIEQFLISKLTVVKKQYENSIEKSKESKEQLKDARAVEEDENKLYTEHPVDIVWYETENVGGVDVLVPKIYSSGRSLELGANSIDGNSTGAVIKGEYVHIDTNKFENIGSTIQGDGFVNIEAGDILNKYGNGSLAEIKGGNINLVAENDIRNIGGDIGGTGTVSLRSINGDIINETVVERKNNLDGFQDKVVASGVILGENVILDSGRDIFMNGGIISATDQVLMKASGNISIDAIKLQSHYSMKNQTESLIEDRTTHIGSGIFAGNGVAIIAEGNVDILGSTIKTDRGDLVVSGDKVTITGLKDIVESTYARDTMNFIGLGDKEDIYSYSETLSSANLDAGEGSLKIMSNKDLDIKGTHLKGLGDEGYIVSKDGDVNIGAIELKQEYKRTLHSVGIFGMGNNDGVSDVVLNSRKDLLGQYDDTHSGNAKSGLLSSPGINESAESMHSKGFQNGVSMSEFYGSGSATGSLLSYTYIDESMEGTSYGRTTLVSGDMLIQGKNDVNLESVDFDVSGKTLHIKSEEGDVNNTYVSDTMKTSVKQVGISIGGEAGYSSGVIGVMESMKSAVDYSTTSDYAGGTASELALRTAEVGGSLSKILSGNLADVYGQAGLSLSFSQKQTNSSDAIDSTIKAGNLIIEAENGNVNLKGFQANVEDIINIKTNDFNMEASKSTYSESETGFSLKAAVQGSGSLTVAGGEGAVEGVLEFSFINSYVDSITYNNATLSGANVVMDIAGDMNLKGANIDGSENLSIDIAGDLNVESVQDKLDHSLYSMDLNATLGVSVGTTVIAPSVNLGVTVGHVTEQKTWVNKQSGIGESSGRVDINVDGNTNLKGAYITGENLNFSTGTLAYENLKDSHIRDGGYVGIGVDIDAGGANSGDIKFGRVEGVYKNRDVNSTIGQGNVMVGGERLENIGSDINRDMDSSIVVTRDDKHAKFDIDYSISMPEDGKDSSSNKLTKRKGDSDGKNTVNRNIREENTTNIVKKSPLRVGNGTNKNITMPNKITENKTNLKVSYETPKIVPIKTSEINLTTPRKNEVNSGIKKVENITKVQVDQGMKKVENITPIKIDSGIVKIEVIKDVKIDSGIVKVEIAKGMKIDFGKREQIEVTVPTITPGERIIDKIERPVNIDGKKTVVKIDKMKKEIKDTINIRKEISEVREKPATIKDTETGREITMKEFLAERKEDNLLGKKSVDIGEGYRKELSESELAVLRTNPELDGKVVSMDENKFLVIKNDGESYVIDGNTLESKVALETVDSLLKDAISKGDLKQVKEVLYKGSMIEIISENRKRDLEILNLVSLRGKEDKKLIERVQKYLDTPSGEGTYIDDKTGKIFDIYKDVTSVEGKKSEEELTYNLNEMEKLVVDREIREATLIVKKSLSEKLREGLAEKYNYLKRFNPKNIYGYFKSPQPDGNRSIEINRQLENVLGGESESPLTFSLDKTTIKEFRRVDNGEMDRAFESKYGESVKNMEEGRKQEFLKKIFEDETLDNKNRNLLISAIIKEFTPEKNYISLQKGMEIRYTENLKNDKELMTLFNEKRVELGEITIDEELLNFKEETNKIIRRYQNSESKFSQEVDRVLNTGMNEKSKNDLLNKLENGDVSNKDFFRSVINKLYIRDKEEKRVVKLKDNKELLAKKMTLENLLKHEERLFNKQEKILIIKRLSKARVEAFNKTAKLSEENEVTIDTSYTRKPSENPEEAKEVAYYDPRKDKVALSADTSLLELFKSIDHEFTHREQLKKIEGNDELSKRAGLKNLQNQLQNEAQIMSFYSPVKLGNETDMNVYKTSFLERDAYSMMEMTKNAFENIFEGGEREGKVAISKPIVKEMSREETREFLKTIGSEEYVEGINEIKRIEREAKIAISKPIVKEMSRKETREFLKTIGSEEYVEGINEIKRIEREGKTAISKPIVKEMSLEETKEFLKTIGSEEYVEGINEIKRREREGEIAISKPTVKEISLEEIRVLLQPTVKEMSPEEIREFLKAIGSEEYVEGINEIKRIEREGKTAISKPIVKEIFPKETENVLGNESEFSYNFSLDKTTIKQSEVDTDEMDRAFESKYGESVKNMEEGRMQELLKEISEDGTLDNKNRNLLMSAIMKEFTPERNYIFLQKGMEIRYTENLKNDKELMTLFNEKRAELGEIIIDKELLDLKEEINKIIRRYQNSESKFSQEVDRVLNTGMNEKSKNDLLSKLENEDFLDKDLFRFVINKLYLMDKDEKRLVKIKGNKEFLAKKITLENLLKNEERLFNKQEKILITKRLSKARIEAFDKAAKLSEKNGITIDTTYSSEPSEIIEGLIVPSYYDSKKDRMALDTDRSLSKLFGDIDHELTHREQLKKIEGNDELSKRVGLKKLQKELQIISLDTQNELGNRIGIDFYLTSFVERDAYSMMEMTKNAFENIFEGGEREGKLAISKPIVKEMSPEEIRGFLKTIGSEEYVEGIKESNSRNRKNMEAMNKANEYIEKRLSPIKDLPKDELKQNLAIAKAFEKEISQLQSDNQAEELYKQFNYKDSSKEDYLITELAEKIEIRGADRDWEIELYRNKPDKNYGIDNARFDELVENILPIAIIGERIEKVRSAELRIYTKIKEEMKIRNNLDYEREVIQVKMILDPRYQAMVLKSNVGNCAEKSRLFAGVVKNRYPNKDIEIVIPVGIEHQYVIMGRNQNTDLNNPSTWNDSAIIVDYWRGKILKAKEFFLKTQDRDEYLTGKGAKPGKVNLEPLNNFNSKLEVSGPELVLDNKSIDENTSLSKSNRLSLENIDLDLEDNLKMDFGNVTLRKIKSTF